jgi:hypothetical protein
MLKKASFVIMGVLLTLSFALGEDNKNISLISKDIIAAGTIPPEANKIVFYEQKTGTVHYRRAFEKTDADNGVILNEQMLQDIYSEIRQLKQKNVNIDLIRIKFEKADGTSMPNEYNFSLPFEFQESNTPASGTPPQASKDTEEGYPTLGEAQNALREMIRIDAARRKEKKYITIIFDDNLLPLEVWPDRNSVGDLIYVGIIYNKLKGFDYFSVDYSPCSAESEIAPIFQGGTFINPNLQAGKNEYLIKYFPPQCCYNQSVDIAIKAGTDKNEIKNEGRYTLKQYNRYRGTLQMGILFSDQHETAFGLNTIGGKKFIFSKGPINTGPEYFTSLVIYSFLKYFPGLGHYSGRDILNDNDFIDRMGAVIGVGLSNPGDRFVLGLSFEVAYGFNIIAVRDFVRLNELGAGLKEGDKFAGTEEEIPLHRYWTSQWAFGISVDLRYITALFSKR